jgi:hypothetical protein
MTIYLDFDGTVVEHQYPKIGRENFGCMEVIKKLQDAGHKIVLNTYRAEVGNGTLAKAIDYINLHHAVELNDMIEVSSKKIHPPEWDIERQIIEEVLFIDDQARNIPLKPTIIVENSKMVDWDKLDEQFKKHGLY